MTEQKGLIFQDEHLGLGLGLGLGRFEDFA